MNSVSGLTLIKLPVLDIRCLGNDDRSLQRAHMTLAFIVHFYVHSQPPKSQPGPVTVPRCLAIPLVEASRLLGTAPVLTFADVGKSANLAISRQ